jgi:hypothetical protein
MVFATDIRKAILKLANQRGVGGMFYPQEVAKLLDSENWPKIIEQVKLVAESLIKEGQIASVGTENVENAYTKPSLQKEGN